jgi:hypothetical protein
LNRREWLRRSLSCADVSALAVSGTITACDIADVALRIDQYVPHAWLAWLAARAFAVDRRFGSANYMPLADAAVYRVVITQSGFNAEPVNQPARAANGARP